MNKPIPKIKAPEGFSFKVKQVNQRRTSVTLYSDKLDIGHVSLIKYRDGYYETHSYLDDDYHGKGLGALLYARAIQHVLENGWRVRSSGNSSSEAKRVWKGKTIRKYFSIKLKKARDRDYDKWYAYAK